ncbi:uncharacterized protein conserved in archaea [Aeropyrum camini SY1 = JCM 12091]|uniref:Uncharacterized protein conserved in archaea n=1 Tax=Aeropyrum camini SY1 = JCM 12091 TaxID=1198449 RepID=U3TCU7_9CREN|nr:uncharacterized protein conserved in archaea [Aeropyrum camini SY1 = JCM 12091]
MRGRRRRVVAVNLRLLDIDDYERFLERLSRAIKVDYSSWRREGDKLLIEMVGGESSIRESIVRLKTLLREYRRGASSGGLVAYSLRRVSREAGLAVPPDLLSTVLSAMGYRAEARGGEGVLATDAPWGLVLEVAREVGERLREVAAQPLATSSRKLVVAASILAGSTLDDAVRAAVEAGLLEEDEKGRLLVRGSWRESLKNLLKALQER